VLPGVGESAVPSSRSMRDLRTVQTAALFARPGTTTHIFRWNFHNVQVQRRPQDHEIASALIEGDPVSEPRGLTGACHGSQLEYWSCSRSLSVGG
jgi:hypothetical protein